MYIKYWIYKFKIFKLVYMACGISDILEYNN